MNYKIYHPTKKIKCEINTPSSKSISNRLLIIQALCKEKFKIYNLSKSDDTLVLKKNLENKKNHIDVGASGTALRFLTAYLAVKEDVNCILTGSKRIQKRPIQELIYILNKLGANISYIKNNNYVPVKIIGQHIKGGEVDIKGDISSQFISSIILIAPSLKNGLKLRITGEIVSKPYIEMTLSIMSKFGIQYTWKENIINIPHQKYNPHDIKVEGDWSSVAFWMQTACLANKCDIKLKGIQKESIQGDKEVINIFSKLGVSTNFKEDAIVLYKNNKIDFPKKINIINNPDLYQPLKCILFTLNISCNFEITRNYPAKGTNRITRKSRFITF